MSARYLERLIVGRTQRAIKIRCPAKVNLFLKVLGKRSDGYHEVQNLLQTVTLFDELTVQKRRASITLRWAGEYVEGPLEENLAFRAAELLLRKAGAKGGVALELKKNIPVAAGLGGGSSDAACCLLALNELFGAGLSPDDLRSLAAELGSDAAFFIEGGAALCTGRGEIVKPIRSRVTFSGVLVTPKCRFRTTEMYAALEPEDMRGPDVSAILRSIESGDLSGVCSSLFNSFERVAFQKEPALKDLKRTLEESGCLRVILCGSGPTLLGICGTTEEAEAVLRAVSEQAPPRIRLKAVMEPI